MQVATNPITGDTLIRKPVTKAYEEGWDRIFSSKKQECDICGKILADVTECQKFDIGEECQKND
jgi:hypothetical protein